MQIKPSYIAIVVLFIASLLGAYLYGRSQAKSKIEYRDVPVTQFVTKDSVRVDTVVRQKPPIVIIDSANYISYSKDTVTNEPKFTACLDTIVSKDTLGVCYSYPENIFQLKARFAKDSIIEKTTYLTNTKVIEIKRAWWIDVLTHLGAFGLGYIIGSK